MNSPFEIKKAIPIGSDLRVLLNSEHISRGEVQSILKSKGIFVGNSDKSITVPILSSTLLTPDDFSNLIESSVERESRPKTKISGLDLVSDSTDWMSPLKESLFSSDFDPAANIASIEFLRTPDLVVENRDRITIPYEVHRRDFSKDWVERELRFGGEIIIERQGNCLKLDFASRHSSKETEAINRRITTRICKILKDSNAVWSEAPKRITFGGFSNTERVRFFKRLTGGVPKSFALGAVNDMEICRDLNAPPLPNDPQIAWMNQTVKRIKIDGERLNDIFLIADEKYYPYYHVQHIDITYTYAISANLGSCRLAFSFSGTSKSDASKDDAELVIDIVRVTHENQVNSESKKAVLQTLERTARNMVEREYDRVIQERDPLAA
jgi:hypothetical protein